MRTVLRAEYFRMEAYVSSTPSILDLILDFLPHHEHATEPAHVQENLEQWFVSRKEHNTHQSTDEVQHCGFSVRDWWLAYSFLRKNQLPFISIVKVTASPTFIFSFFRTSALSGKRYVFDLLSGKMDVFHIVFPMVTATGIEPHPFAIFPNRFLISEDCFWGMVIKCQPTIPG